MKASTLSLVAICIALPYSCLLFGQVSIVDLPYTPLITDFDNFDPEDVTGLNNTIPTGWTGHSSGTPVFQGRGNGSSNGGGYWAYGITAGTDWSLGALRSGTPGDITYSYRMINNTGFTIHQISIAWDYEQWRYAGNTSGFNCQGTDALSGNSILNSMDLTGMPSGTNGIPSVTSVSFELTDLEIGDGEIFGISWRTTDMGGSDNGVAVDNFSISACTRPLINNTDLEACSGELFSHDPEGVPSNTTYSWSLPAGSGFIGGEVGVNEEVFFGNLFNTTDIPVIATYTVIPHNGECDGEEFIIMVTLDPCPPGSLLEWVLLTDENETNGLCTSQSDCDDNILCYGLKYTPGTTGILSGYTAQFSINCTGLSNSYPVILNQSCQMMTGNDNVVDECSTQDITYFQSNGINGTLNVTEQVPVILHQICITLAPGETLSINSFPGEYAAIFEPPVPPEIMTYNITEINSDEACLILPVNWLEFNVSRLGELQSKLTWRSGNELNDSHFEIQRSTDNGDTFSTIDEVRAIINSTFNQYIYLDKYSRPGRNLYRIIKYDRDGQFDISEVREIIFYENGNTLRIWPNPAQASINLAFAKNERSGYFRMFDSMGNMVLEYCPEMGIGNGAINVSELSAGLYTIVFESDFTSCVDRIIISR